MEQMTVTAKIQVKTSPEEKVLLDKTMSAYRDACNFVSDYVFRTHDLKQFSLNKALYTSLREQYALKSQMAQSVLKTVIARYKTILENQKEWIRPTFKKPQYDLVWNRDYSLTNERFSVNTLDGRIKLSYFASGMEKYFDHNIYHFGTAKLVNKHGKYFLHIPVSFDIEESNPSDICNVVGIDRGINFVVATYDSKHHLIANIIPGSSAERRSNRNEPIIPSSANSCKCVKPHLPEKGSKLSASEKTVGCRTSITVYRRHSFKTIRSIRYSSLKILRAFAMPPSR